MGTRRFTSIVCISVTILGAMGCNGILGIQEKQYAADDALRGGSGGTGPGAPDSSSASTGGTGGAFDRTGESQISDASSA